MNKAITTGETIFDTRGNTATVTRGGTRTIHIRWNDGREHTVPVARMYDLGISLLPPTRNVSALRRIAARTAA